MIPGPLPELRFIDMNLAYRWIGTPYVWAGQSLEGGDCSGHQIWRFRQQGLIGPNDDYTANGLWDLFQEGGRVEKEGLGRLAIYGRSFLEITHVAYCLGNGLSIDAIGNSSLDTAEKARKRGAFFKVMNVHRRPDLLGYVDPFQYLKAKGAT